jgi:hypothetical protein
MSGPAASGVGRDVVGGGIVVGGDTVPPVPSGGVVEVPPVVPGGTVFMPPVVLAPPPEPPLVVLGVEPLLGAPAPGVTELPPVDAPPVGSESDAVHASAKALTERAATTSVELRAAEVLMLTF